MNGRRGGRGRVLTAEILKDETGTTTASDVLRTVSLFEAFLFFTAIMQYTGVFASSLSDFYRKLMEVPSKSIEFHFKRGDFEKWIRSTLGDRILADRISRINRSLRRDKLRMILQEAVKERIEELKVQQYPN